MIKTINTFLQKNSQKQILLDIAFSIFLLSIFLRFIISVFEPHDYESWGISEFLINYQGGFVRRGLIGEILFFLVVKYNFDIIWSIKIICVSCFVLVAVFFVREFIKKGYSLYILPLCFFLSAGITEYWIRKDYLFFCFFIPIMWVYAKVNLSIFKKVLLINILGIFIILSHEVFAFFALPILFLLFFSRYKENGFLKSLVLSFVSLFPVIIIFLFALYYHGTEQTAQLIWDSWVPYFTRETSRIGYSVYSLGWSTVFAVKFHTTTNFLSIDHNICSFWIWSIVIPVVYYISTNVLFVFRKDETVFTEKDRTILSSILIFQFLCLSPIFIFLSIDYLRVNFYWIASSYTVFLLVSRENIEKLFPTLYMQYVCRLNNFLINILYPSKTTLIFLMFFIGIPSHGFTIEMLYTKTMLYNVLLILSQPFLMLKGLLFA